MDVLRIWDSADLLFMYAIGFITDVVWVGLGAYFARRYTRGMTLAVVLPLAVLILPAHPDFHAQHPGRYLVLMAGNLLLKGLLSVLVCRRGGGRGWAMCVLAVSLTLQLVLLAPFLGVHFSGRFVGEMHMERYDYWSRIAGYVVLPAAICQGVAAAAFYRCLQRCEATDHAVAPLQQ